MKRKKNILERGKKPITQIGRALRSAHLSKAQQIPSIRTAGSVPVGLHPGVMGSSSACSSSSCCRDLAQLDKEASEIQTTRKVSVKVSLRRAQKEHYNTKINALLSNKRLHCPPSGVLVCPLRSPLQVPLDHLMPNQPRMSQTELRELVCSHRV